MATCSRCGGKKRGELELCSKCRCELRRDVLEKEKAARAERKSWRLQPPKGYHGADSLSNALDICRKESEAIKRDLERFENNEHPRNKKTISPETMVQASQKET